jgi:hypothetical protein
MLVDITLAFFSICCLMWSMATYSTTGHCPDGWWVNGVRPTGLYSCRPRSLLPDRPSRGHEQDEPDDPAADHEICNQIYCTGGSHPIVVDFRTVGCQR